MHRTLLLLGCCLAACAPPPLPVVQDEPWEPGEGECPPPSIDAPDQLVDCASGNGLFGRWVLGADAQPAYDYRFDQRADARAAWWNTEHLDRRDHWFALGNGRVNVMAFNEGYVQVATQDRGVSSWNAYDEARKNFSGGFGWLDDGEETWSTAYAWRPQPSRTSRTFGLTRAVFEVEHRGVRSSRTIQAPPGDGAVVVATVTLTNTSKQTRTLRHYEYWDVARRNVEINWIVAGDPFASLPGDARAKRDALNGDFREEVSWDDAARALLLRRTLVDGLVRPDRMTPDPKDWYPDDQYLAVLEGPVSSLYTEQAAFFGEGGVAAPAMVTARSEGTAPAAGVLGRSTGGAGQSRMFVVRSDLTLKPGESKTLRFAYGAVPQGGPLELPPLDGSPDDELRPHLFSFAAPEAPHLQRELAWDSAQAEASVGRRDYQGQHVLPQGSAYLYLHGADGAARDLSLFTLPLVFTHRSLAREELLLNMKVSYGADRRLSYAFQGNGMLDDALGLHSAPSDLTLFLLWALTEYVEATGDASVLDEPVPYWPTESVPGATGWTHLHDAVRHLFDVVGTGPHGLLRVGTGDWSDGIVAETSVDRALAISRGESVPNSQMALYVLPRAAALVEPRDAALAAEIRAKLPGLRAAVQAAWSSAQFGRAYFGDGVLFHASAVDLEAQVWPLISGDGFPTPAVRAALLDTVHTRLDAPSPTGATLLEQGQVWPAISALLTWGYARSGRMDLAWQHLARNTMHEHAKAFPGVWYGIWSAPDGLASSWGDRPGEAWFSPATPMTDFPVQNNNATLLPIFAALKTAGVEVVPGGLHLEPGQTTHPFAFKTELLDLRWDGVTLSGTYRPVSARHVEVVLPTALTSCTVNGAPIGASGTTVGFDTSGPTTFTVR